MKLSGDTNPTFAHITRDTHTTSILSTNRGDATRVPNHCMVVRQCIVENWICVVICGVWSCIPKFISRFIMLQIAQISFRLNALRPRQNDRHFPDDIFRCIFLNGNIWISLNISLKFVPKDPINNIPVMVLIMARRRQGDKPLYEPIMVSLLTHICATRSQWANCYVDHCPHASLFINKHLSAHAFDPHCQKTKSTKQIYMDQRGMTIVLFAKLFEMRWYVGLI